MPYYSTSRLGAFWLQVPDFFTFTFVAEPLTRLVDGILQTTRNLTGEQLVAILREMVRRERESTGNWTSSKHRYDVHWASQVALLMNMFDAPWTMWGISKVWPSVEPDFPRLPAVQLEAWRPGGPGAIQAHT